MNQAIGLITGPMAYVYLFYGLAFIAMGIVIALQARSPIRVLPADSLWLLATFGLLHGTHEWVTMSTSGDDRYTLVDLINRLLLPISFAFLMQFGLELLIALKRWPTWTRVIPGGLVAIWAALSLSIVLPLDGSLGAEQSITEALARYILGFLGSLVAAYALWAASRQQSASGARRVSEMLAGGAVALAAYAFFAGLIVPPAPFPAASLVNGDTFRDLVIVPVEVFRAICAIAISGFLSEALVVEASRRQVEMQRQREEFISIIAHDLRAPLTTINLAADLLERLPAQGHKTERERSMLANIKSSARSMSRMIEDLLDASRIEAKRLTLQKETVDLCQLLTEVIDRAGEITKSHQIKTSMPEVVPPVEADPGRVEQVLFNLLSNAAKYSYPNTDILVEVAPRPNEVMISITNYGPGIKPQEIPHLFSRYYRTRTAETGKTPGLGLGLYIARGLVEAQGGRIWVESEPDKYATFRFTLPSIRHP